VAPMRLRAAIAPADVEIRSRPLALLYSIATRAWTTRDISRYMTGLLVFLGRLGTFLACTRDRRLVGKVIAG